MNKYANSNIAKQELQQTGEITMLEDKADETTYNKILLKSKTKDEMITKMQEAEFSEFAIGTIIGYLLATEARLEKKSWIPKILRKW